MLTNKNSDGNKEEDCFAVPMCVCVFSTRIDIGKVKLTPTLASRVEHNVVSKIINTNDKSGLSPSLKWAHNGKIIIGI